MARSVKLELLRHFKINNLKQFEICLQLYVNRFKTLGVELDNPACPVVQLRYNTLGYSPEKSFRFEVLAAKSDSAKNSSNCHLIGL